MKGIDIIEALNGLDEEMVLDAKRHGKVVPKWLKYGSLAACVCFLVGAAGIWLGAITSSTIEAHSNVTTEAAPWESAPATETSPSVRESLIIKAQPDTWEPWYSGGERRWDYVDPWAYDPWPGEYRATEQSEGMSAYGDIQKSREDYGGCYLNCSGTLTVLIVDPTEETAAEYAAMTDVGIWIVEAEYTLKELEEVNEGIHADVTRWLEEHPESGLILNSSGLNEQINRVVLHLSGTSLDYFMEHYDLPECVCLALFEVTDSSAWEAIPREPDTKWTTEAADVSVYVAQQTYPVGTDTIHLVFENNTSGLLTYGYSYTLEKYVDGQWINASGNQSFVAVGLSVEEYGVEVMQIRTELFPAELGVGLYRVIGCELGYEPYPGYTMHAFIGQYTVEFCVTEDAPEPEEIQLSGRWQSSASVLQEGEIALNLWGPFVAGISTDILEATAEDHVPMTFNIYDRRTGRAVNDTPYEFMASYPNDLYADTQAQILYIRTEETVYGLRFQGIDPVLEEGLTFPDEDFPRRAETSYSAMDGGFTVEMTRHTYSLEDGIIGITFTNNTNMALSTEALFPVSAFQKVGIWGWESVFVREEDAEEALTSIDLTLKPGAHTTIEMDVNEWGLWSEAEDGTVPLTPGVYRLIFNDRVFTRETTGEEYPVCFMVEFELR